MKTKYVSFLSVIVILILSTSLYSLTQKNTPKMFDKGDKYKKQWAKVDSLERLGLPKSALEIVEDIYKRAKNDKNSDQIIKSFIFRLKYKNTNEENAFEKLIGELDSVTKVSDFPNNAVMHSMLSEMYWMYYQSNRWKFQNRSNTVNFKNDDMQTWSLDQLTTTIIKHYHQSLENAENLQKTPMTTYDEVISWGTQPKTLRPTLYDFLAQRAIEFFSNSEISLTKPADYFQLKEDFYFDDAKVFANTTINSKDTLSLHFHGIKILQDLIKFRLSESNEDAMIDVDLQRLHFVKAHSVNEAKDSLYFNRLQTLEKKYANNPYSSEISYLIAEYYNRQGSKYDFLNKETAKYKDSKKTANEICERVIKTYPKSSGTEKCKYLQRQLSFRNLNFQVEENLIANQTFPIRIEYTNIDKIYIRVATMNKEKLVDLQREHYGQELYDLILKHSKQVLIDVKDLPVDKDFNVHSIEYLTKALPFGFYVIIVANNDKFTYNKNLTAYDFVNITNISYIQQKEEDGTLNIHVINRKTGEPIKNVSVVGWYETYNYKQRKYKREEIGKFITDAEGYFKVKSRANEEARSLFFDFKIDGDSYSSHSSSYLYYSKAQKYKYQHVNLYSDRAIYRPGQTIYFKGIVTESEGDSVNIVPKHAETVVLYDVNFQKVSELTLTTNEYGTFNGSFVIPTGLINGTMQLYTSNGAMSFQVEEYKRPTFEVLFQPFKGNYMLNDMVEFTGNAKSYAGTNLTDATVKYRVQRSPRWFGWWYYYFKQAEVEIANGTLTTNDKGEFTVKFKAIPDLSMTKNEFLAFNYKIVIDVTDINGETQSSTQSMTVGYRALQVGLDISTELSKEEAKEAKISTQNLNGEFIAAKGSIKIYKLQDLSTFYRTKKWKQTDKHFYTKEEWAKLYPNVEYESENDVMQLPQKETVLDVQFDTEKNKKLDLTALKTLGSARYVAEIKSVDAFQNPVVSRSYFTLLSETDKTLPYKTTNLFQTLNNSGEPGETAKYIIGTSEQNVKVLFEIEHKNEIIKKQWLTLSNNQQLIEIPIEEKHRGNFSVHFIFIKENEIYNFSDVVTVPFTNKQLDIKFETFRDKLQPGQNEEWKMKITGKRGEKVAAELLATLYDASLDVFAKNAWALNVYRSYYTVLPWHSECFTTTNATLLKYGIDEYYAYPSLYYDRFNWFGFSYYSYHYRYYAEDADGDVVMAKTKSATLKGNKKNGGKEHKEEEEKSEVMFDMVTTAESVGEEKKQDVNENVPPPPPSSPEAKEKDKGKDFSDVKVRTNFNETAFFMPQIATDENGNLVVKFTIPESLTKWRMMGLAHTKDLKIGYIENSLITQKTLMVMPNAPRFFRENDEMEFPVKINNISEKDLTGETQLEFFDAITMKPVQNILIKEETALKSFTVKAGGNTLVTWKLKIPEDLGAITYKVVAKADEFSDGEQKALPVLTNRMLVTESMPLPIRSNQTKTFKFEKLINSGKSKTLKNFKLTLEFTSNPAWYAIQALPYLMEYPYECNEQTFSRFYANSIASHIANSNPKIKRVFDSWKSNKESLLSNLEKNQELKSVLLEETPWVLNGQNETERKNRVGLLFDLNKMSDELGRAMKKLQKGQAYNGGWSWFAGMPESWYITQHIVCGMGHLDRLGVTKIRQDQDVWSMLTKAISFIDGEIKTEYDNLKRIYSRKELEENHLSYMAIHYMYGRSFFKDVQIPSSSKDAFNYFKGQMEKYWLKQDQYAKGLIALSLSRYDSKKIAKDVVKSLGEFSTSNEEMGMYWKNNVSGYFWYQAPIETQALMIEVFDEVTNDQKAVDDMQVWLLKQKQTQDWKTTKATVEACYALLLKGTDKLASDELVQIKLGDMEVNPKKMDNVQVEAGTGYFKTSWSGGEIKPEWGNVTVTKTDKGVSWGALYWQYFEQLDKITPHETPLKLSKKLFREVITDRGKVIEPITDKTKLKVGDKVIVRIELRVDREMEYVHMKDMRASGFEPINVISQYKFQDGLGYYESTKDAATNFFIGYLRKGTFVFEYPLRVTHNGDFSNGITTIQCMYAPEFTSHSEGVRVKVEK